jgi:putative N6-adenine-specific DNA methylase
VQVGRMTIRDPKDILTGTTNIAWEEWFSIHEAIRIDFSVGREPKLAAPLARNYATLLIKDGICDRFRMKTGERPSIDTQLPDIRVWAYLDQNNLTLYIDTSGEPLFKRGWRRGKGDAPLRENLAAALIAMTEWDGKTALMDPFCGSGTLLIEAMQRACGLPPNFLPRSPRSFSAEKLQRRSPMGSVDWSKLRDEAGQAIENAIANVATTPLPAMVGSDIDEQLIGIAQENAARALPTPIAAAIHWQVASFKEATPHAQKGLWVTNPPYGKRLGRESIDFEREIAEVLKRQFAGWQAWILTDNLKLESAMRLKSSRRVPVFNGDLDCRWMKFDMVSGSMRDKAKEGGNGDSNGSTSPANKSNVSSSGDTRDSENKRHA